MSSVKYRTDGNPDGTSFGQATTEKISFYGVTPVVQPSGAGQAALTDSTGGTASTTFAAITGSATYASADITAIKNALSQLVVSFNKLRTDLVALGLWAGA